MPVELVTAHVGRVTPTTLAAWWPLARGQSAAVRDDLQGTDVDLGAGRDHRAVIASERRRRHLAGGPGIIWCPLAPWCEAVHAQAPNLRRHGALQRACRGGDASPTAHPRRRCHGAGWLLDPLAGARLRRG